MGECLLCHKFMGIQLDLHGIATIKPEVCYGCRPEKNVIILCPETKKKVEITDEEAITIFYKVPDNRFAVLSPGQFHNVLVKLMTANEDEELRKLKNTIADHYEIIESLKGEISEHECDIETLKDEMQTYYDYRVEDLK